MSRWNGKLWEILRVEVKIEDDWKFKSKNYSIG